MERTDEDLAAACSSGRLEDFDLLYQRYARPIYAFAYRRVSDRATAEDITSATFLNALEGIRSFSLRKGPFRAWLYRIARNAIIDHARAAKHRAVAPLDETSETVPSEDRAEERAERAISGAHARRALSTLPDLPREIVMLRLWEDLPYAEIAAVVGKREDHCKVLYSRAIASLRSTLHA